MISLALAALALAQGPGADPTDPADLTAELDRLVARANGMRTLHATYDAAADEGAAVLELVLRLPDAARVSMTAAGGAVDFRLADGRAFVRGPWADEWRSARLPARPAAAELLDELFPPPPGWPAQGPVVLVSGTADEPAGGTVVQVRIGWSATRYACVLDWLAGMRADPALVVADGASLRWSRPGSPRVAVVSRATGLLERFEVEGEPALALREARIDEPLDPALLALPEAARSAPEDPALQADLDRLADPLLVRADGLERALRGLGPDAQGAETLAAWRTFAGVLHRDVIAAAAPRRLEEVRRRCASLAAWRAQELARDPARAPALAEQLAEACGAAVAELAAAEEAYAALLADPDAQGALRELLDVERAVVAEAWRELVSDPAARAMDALLRGE